jgi:hypothetical protein
MRRIGLRTLCRVLLVLYVLFLVACIVVFATDGSTGGPYDGIGKAMAAIGAGLPWTLLAFVFEPLNAGPRVLYAFGVAAAAVNLMVLARFSGWLPSRA